MSETESNAATPPGAPEVDPQAEPAAGSADALRQELAAAKARAEEFRAQHLRAAAELDNFRKRAAREMESARAYGVERFAGELLAVIDSLELGLAAGESVDPRTLREGQEATLRLLVKAFEKAGIAPVDPAGAVFDPAQHEAVAMQPTEGEANRVLAVVQKGYVLSGRLLRPARVVVSKGAAA
jgi:molecular chaperone GrpE